jgi:hypothetical protein
VAKEGSTWLVNRCRDAAVRPHAGACEGPTLRTNYYWTRCGLKGPHNRRAVALHSLHRDSKHLTAGSFRAGAQTCPTRASDRSRKPREQAFPTWLWSNRRMNLLVRTLKQFTIQSPVQMGSAFGDEPPEKNGLGDLPSSAPKILAEGPRPAEGEQPLEGIGHRRSGAEEGGCANSARGRANHMALNAGSILVCIQQSTPTVSRRDSCAGAFLGSFPAVGRGEYSVSGATALLVCGALSHARTMGRSRHACRVAAPAWRGGKCLPSSH